MSLRRQGDPDKSAVESFLRVMIDRGLKVLKIAAGAAVRSAPLGIGAALRPVDVAQMLIAEEVDQPAAALRRLLWPRLSGRNVRR